MKRSPLNIRRLRKLYHQEIIDQIQRSSTPQLFEAACWASKESAFKHFDVQMKKFNPKAFEINQISLNSGLSRISYEDEEVEVRVSYNQNCLWAYTNASLKSDLIWGGAENIHQIVLETVNAHGMQWRLNKKPNGRPYLQNANQTLNLSISHHGKYGLALVEASYDR